MRIEHIKDDSYELFFDKQEALRLQNESSDNELTIIEMFEMIFAKLFITGYSRIVGKG